MYNIIRNVPVCKPTCLVSESSFAAFCERVYLCLGRKLRQTEAKRVLDEATRQRRLDRQLEALERDNFHEDPHKNVPQITHKLPSFSEEPSGLVRSRYRARAKKYSNTFRVAKRRKTKTEVRIGQVRTFQFKLSLTCLTSFSEAISAFVCCSTRRTGARREESISPPRTSHSPF